ncbi:MAG: SCP2 sterol-binding domain-containing protein [Pseudomonadota bacterium]
MTQTLITQTLSSLLNRYSQRTEQQRNALSQLDGQLFLLHCTHPNITCYLNVHNAQIELHTHKPSQADHITSTLEGRASKLLALLQSDEPSSMLSQDDLQLRGDANAFNLLLSTLTPNDIDYEAPLARIIGDVPAHGIGKLIRGLRKQLNQHTQALTKHALTPNNGALVNPQELEQFTLDVRATQQETERLHAKLNAYKHTLSPTE